MSPHPGGQSFYDVDFIQTDHYYFLSLLNTAVRLPNKHSKPYRIAMSRFVFILVRTNSANVLLLGCLLVIFVCRTFNSCVL